MKKSLFLSILLAFTFSQLIFGQKTLSFSDSMQVSAEKLIACSVVVNNTVIIGGTSNLDSTPYIACYNSDGQKLWSNADSIKRNAFHLLNFIYGNDGFIYTLSYDNYGEVYRLGKVRVTDGKVMWQRNYNFNFILGISIINKDSNSIGVFITTGIGLNYKYLLSLVKKSNGDTLHSIIVGNYANTIVASSDRNGNIYYVYNNQLIKTDSTNPGQVTWSKKYYLTAFDTLYNFEKIFFSDAGEMYAIADGSGYHSSGFSYVLKINPGTGQMIWMSEFLAYNSQVQTIKENNGFLYINSDHIYFGSDTSYFNIAKLNMSDGSFAWKVSLKPTGKKITGINKNSLGNQNGAEDFVMDSLGDIYLTGYYGDGPGNYGILKIKGADGSKVFESDITLDSSRTDEHSSGYVACLLDNKPTFIGVNQPKSNRLQYPFVTFTQLNSAGGIALFKNLAAYHKFPTSVLKASVNSKGKLVILKQIGMNAVLTAYDSSLHVVWNTMLPTWSFGNMALRMATNKIGIKCIISLRTIQTAFFPYYSIVTDSLYATLVNDSGRVLNTYSISTGNGGYSTRITNSDYVNLYGDSTEFYLTWSNRVYRINRSSVSTITTNFGANYAQPECDLFASLSSTEIIYLDGHNLLTFNKMTLYNTASTYLGTAEAFYDILREDNRLFVCNNLNGIISYGLPKMDTLWRKYYDNQQGAFVKMISDSQGYIYTMGTSVDRSNYTYDIMVKKIQAATGNLIWSYNYVSPLKISQPNNIWYDKINKTVSVCGYESSSKVSIRPVAITLTSGRGKLVSLYKPVPAIDGDARATDIISNGHSVFVTGFMKDSNNLRSGFIYASHVDTLVPEAAFTIQGACVHSPIHFMNKSINGSSYSWDFGDGSALSTTASPAHTYTSTGTYHVMLKVKSTNSRVDSVSQTITIVSDCVWPGDANADKKVDLSDLLPIGIAYGQTGPDRPNASLVWEGQNEKNWSKSFLSGANYKHADCNGDSIIDSKDTSAIRLNFSQTHLKRMEINEADATDPLLYLKARSNKLNIGDTLVEDIFLGTSGVPANNIYGLAFNVSFDNSIFDATATRIDAGAPWIKSGSSPFLEMDRHAGGNIDIAMVRTDANNQSGYGKIATLYIPVKQSITAKEALLLSNNLAIDNSGKSISLNAQSDTVSIPTSIMRASASQESIALYPNPFNGSTTISYSLQQAGHVSITIRDMAGRNIETIDRFSAEGMNQLKIDGLGKGIYFLEMHTNGQSRTFKLLSL